jgi:site-specific recombinase XerD
MGRLKKRTRITASKHSSSGITIREIQKSRHGCDYTTHLIQGWKENGKWQKREIKDKAKAEAFADSKRIELKNEGRHHALVMSSLTQEQQDEAESAINRLKGIYSLNEVVDYHLQNHRSPDFTISLKDAVARYLYDIEQDLSASQFRSIRQILNRFMLQTGHPNLTEIGSIQIKSYLKSLRARDGVNPATRASWNLHRSNLNGFFKWASESEHSNDHPFIFTNPVAQTRFFKKRQVDAERSGEIITSSLSETIHRLTILMRWRNGELIPYIALMYFAGMRPSEVERLAPVADKQINRKTKTIKITAKISKTNQARIIKISDNLAAWLDAFPFPIKPPNLKRKRDKVWKHFSITHDELRHSFISYHVARGRSKGDTALQAGNSESVIVNHYLDVFTEEEGADFFSIFPSEDKRKAIISLKN